MNRRAERGRAAVELADAITAARARVAAEQAALADLCVRYADARIADERSEGPSARADAPKPGAFVADEVAMLLCEDAWHTSRLLARTRRIGAALPEVASAARAGALDGERVRLIDQAARLVESPHTLAVLDDQVVTAAQTRTPHGLRRWLQRFLAQHEPEALTHRRHLSLADRRVTIAQSITGIGYVTGEVSAEDAAAIDGRLSGLARSLGSADPRSDQQRRSDLFAGLLLGTVSAGAHDRVGALPAGTLETLEVEQVDPDTGELLGTTLVAVDSDGEVLDSGEKLTAAEATGSVETNRSVEATGAGRRRPNRIGVVVPLSSLLGLDDAPGELADRSAMLPAEAIRDLAGQQDTWFTRLLVDDGGRLLDTTELGRFPSERLAEAVRIRAGTCAFPGCRVPAGRCDLDHHEPVPIGPTAARNLDPLCRRHHRGKTFAGLAAHRDQNTVTWTLPTAHTYRCLDEPLPMPTRDRHRLASPG